ncbi:MAG TPA: SbcC/MukB-like Walker B domain-containing protein [Pseudonocardiaceae bacterium]
MTDGARTDTDRAAQAERPEQPERTGQRERTDPGPARTLHLGQFRLTRLQVVNWGTFWGYQDLAVDERGVMFTGPSGSGKSSLMDAHSAVLLPTHDQRFNASADLTARGAKRATRSVADYVRGAWSETNDEHEQSRVRYLRGGRPTWSAVAATYDDGLGSVTTAVVVKWFTGTENDGSSLHSMYQLHNGAFDLTVLEEWAARTFDTRWLKATHPATYPESQSAYMRELAKRIGLGQSRTALTLLGKAKAMKNVGDLNFFVRENMLDEPETFAAARKMVEAFTPLNEAYETARRAFRQERVLRDVPENWERYRTSEHTQTMAESLLGASMERYLRGVQLAAANRELDELDDAIAELDVRLAETAKRRDEARDLYRSLNTQLATEGGALAALTHERETAVGRRDARLQAYQAYRGLVERIGLFCPEREEDFLALRRRLGELAEQARGELRDLKERRHQVFADAGEARRAHQARAAELTALRSARSLIPQRESARREAIAQGAGVPAAELAYAAELIDIAAGEERWRPAAEKVLRGFGLRLLVPERHRDAVKRYIDENDMRGVVEYSVVGGHARPARPAAGTLAARLTVDPAHPAGAWLATQLADRFAHVCVENAAELDGHELAVTVHGTVKMRGNHYRKDDRRELTNPSSYILGANLAAKRAALEAEVTDLEAAARAARERADGLDQEWQATRSTAEAAEQLTGYAAWSEVDHWSADEVVRALDARIERARADNVDLHDLEERCAEAEESWQELVQEHVRLQDTLGRHDARQTVLVEVLEREQDRPHTVDDEAERAHLDAVLADLGLRVVADDLGPVRDAFRKALEKQRDDASGDRRLAHSKIKNAIDRFLEEWPDSAPDDSGDVDRSGGDFAALHEDITRRRLPDAMATFERLISNELVPSISLVQRSVEKASHDIESRIGMVNAGLRRVEFDAGTHLQIAFRFTPPPETREFRGQVDVLLREAPQARREPERLMRQFQRVRALMALFTRDDGEARRWRTTVLDVRTSYHFYGREVNAAGETTTTYRNTATNSGGEQEKLVAFCLAAALSYNLADPDSDGRPRFAPLMLDEAFSKSDETFSQQALGAFDEFGFQLIIAAPIRMTGILEPFIGQAVLVDKRVSADGARSGAATATFGELVAAHGRDDLVGSPRASA